MGTSLSLLQNTSEYAPSLETFKTRLDGSLGSLTCWVGALLMAEGWGSVISKALFNSTHSTILCVHQLRWVYQA